VGITATRTVLLDGPLIFNLRRVLVWQRRVPITMSTQSELERELAAAAAHTGYDVVGAYD